jgi:hypothetical protein
VGRIGLGSKRSGLGAPHAGSGEPDESNGLRRIWAWVNWSGTHIYTGNAHLYGEVNEELQEFISAIHL